MLIVIIPSWWLCNWRWVGRICGAYSAVLWQPECGILGVQLRKCCGDKLYIDGLMGGCLVMMVFSYVSVTDVQKIG
jgi:hypothetical protein